MTSHLPTRRSLLVLLALLLAACGQAGAAQPVPADLPATVAVSSELVGPRVGGAPREGEAAPDFRYTMAGGHAHQLSELRGRVVLVNFWATWCAPCKEEMPDLQRLADEYGDTVTVLGVNKLESLEAIGPFVRQMGVTFTLLGNPEGDISERYGAKNIPLTYFVRPDGTIGAVHIGVMTYDEAKAQVDLLR